MPAPSFVSSSPTNGETAVAKNVVMTVTFGAALLPASVTPESVQLWNSKFNSRVNGDLVLNAAGTVITFAPDEHLFPDCGHRIRLIGADIDAAKCLKSADSSPLATTITITFQTGDDLDTGADEKTDTETDAEGDIELPDDFTVRAVSGAPLRLVSVSKGHNSFGLPTDLNQLVFRFSASLDPLAAEAVEVLQEAFYGEEDLLAREVDLGMGDGLQNYFLAETGYYSDAETVGVLDPTLYEDRGYEISVSGEYMFIDFDADTEFAKNLALEIVLPTTIEDADGNALSEDQVWFGATEPFPRWNSLLDVKHSVGLTVSAQVPDTFVGLRIWRNSVDLMRRLDWNYPAALPTGPMREYVRYKASIDVWDDLIASKALASGTSKRLGDLEITVNTAAGSARPTSMRKFETLLEKLEHNIFGGMTHSPRTGIRSQFDELEPSREFFRDRLWRAETILGPGYSSDTSANTAVQRMQGGRGLILERGFSSNPRIAGPGILPRGTE